MLLGVNLIFREMNESKCTDNKTLQTIAELSLECRSILQLFNVIIYSVTYTRVLE